MRTVAIIGVVLALAGVAAAQPRVDRVTPDRPALPTQDRSLVLLAPTAQAPVVQLLQIEIESQPTERMPVVALRFVPGEVSPDTALFHLTLIDELGAQTIEIPRDTTELYRPGLRVMPRVHVEVRAVTAGGTRSRATTLQVEATPHRAYRCGLGPMIELAMRGFLALVLVAIVLGIIGARRWRGQHDEGEAVAPLVADHIARSVLRRASSATVATLVGLVSAVVLDHTYLAALVAFVAFVPIGNLLAAWRVARELDRERARAELRGTVLIVRSPNGQARLATSRRVIAKAKRQSVPTSIAR